MSTLNFNYQKTSCSYKNKTTQKPRGGVMRDKNHIFFPFRKAAVCLHRTCQVVQVLLDDRTPNRWNSTTHGIFYLTIYWFLSLLGHFFQPENSCSKGVGIKKWKKNKKTKKQTISYINFRCNWLQSLQQFHCWKESHRPSYTMA